MFNHEKQNAEYTALPTEIRTLVDLIGDAHGYGLGRKTAMGWEVTLFFKNQEDATRGASVISDAVQWASALTAPGGAKATINQDSSEQNIVELIYEGGYSFDQPCYYGNRVEEYAVYCHNDAWPDSPRKCRRSVHKPDFLHEDCPGYKSNPHADKDNAW